MSNLKSQKITELPKHVAIIPDGNRRWAREKGLSIFEGHRRGYEAVFEIGKKAREMSIKVLTFWGFSTENWERSKVEVDGLMKIFEDMADRYLDEAMKNQIKIIHLGRKDRLPKSLAQKIVNSEQKTKKFSKYYLCIALDYGGRDEVMRGAIKIKNSKLKIKNLNEVSFSQFLDTKDLPYPNVDLVIRTSGEMRTSGLMIWQAAYSEYIFSKKYFPDFSSTDFEKCINEYMRRQRRFGK